VPLLGIVNGTPVGKHWARPVVLKLGVNYPLG